MLKNTTQRVRFVIVGDGELRSELENYCQEKSLDYGTAPGSNRIVFTSWIREVDVVLAASDIVALTSWNEGTPVSLIEAHAASCPVVTTIAGGVEDIVAQEKTGFLCKPGDTKTFAGDLLKLINSPDLRTTMAAKAQERVMQKYSYRRLCSDMSNLYSRLLSKKA